jgi:RHS repeat-associated protein
MQQRTKHPCRHAHTRVINPPYLTLAPCSFDGLLNLEGFKVKTPGQDTVLDMGHAYGKVQELKTRNRTDTVAGASSTKSNTYQYDAETRLTSAVTDSGGLFGVDTETFTLDLVGNRTAHSRQTGAWVYDSNNRLIKRGNGACASSGVVCYDWDEAGNQVKKTEGAKVTQFGYDVLNRLTDVKNGAGQLIARYGYDPQGRRVWKEQYRDFAGVALSQGKRAYFLYADEGLIAESVQAIRLDASGEVSAVGVPKISAQYGVKPESPFTTGVLFIKTMDLNGKDVVAYYHHDHLMTPVQATDKNGKVVWAAAYEAFGRAVVTTFNGEGIVSNLRFSGQYIDNEIGLHYNLTRYYDGLIGRYLVGDQIGLRGGINTYTYTMNRPTLYIDPDGRFAIALPVLIPVLIVGCILSPGCRDFFTPKTPPRWDPPPIYPPIYPPEPWPDDSKGQCIRLYVLCQDFSWSGNCENCMRRCIAEKEWPFHLCEGTKCQK